MNTDLKKWNPFKFSRKNANQPTTNETTGVLPHWRMLPDELLSFYLLHLFHGLPGAERPAPSAFTFRSSRFNRHGGRLA